MKAFKILCFIAIFSLPLFAQQMFNSCVENETADCPVSLPSAFTTANSKLPDPFKKLDGTNITTKEEWACRRQEILKLAERTVYGTKPPKPSSVTGTVSRTSITVNVSEGGKTGSFSVTVTMPTGGNAPYPAIISYGNSGVSSSTATSNGVAYINFTPTAVGGENANNGRNKSGVFYNIYGTTHQAGTLMAWAWAVSRIIDVIESDPNKLLDPTAIGVTGCSRFGKGPFVAAAFDQRIALAMPMEGGTGGSNLMRLAYSTSGAQSPNSAYGEQPWLGDVFNSFTSNPNNLPIDMHEVVAMIAPRGLLFLDKTPESSDWLCTQASYGAAQAGAEVYKSLNVGSNLHYISNTGSSGHCSWNNVYNDPVADYIKKYLFRTTAVTGNTPTYNAANSTRNPKMSDLIDWTTPTLSGDLTIGGGCGSETPGSSSSATTPSSSSVATETPSSSSAEPVPQVCGEYEENFCGGMAYADVRGNSNSIPITGDCLFIGDFLEIQPDLNSTVSINGLDNVCGTAWAECPYNDRPDKKDGGYYVYVKSGTVNSYQNNGWQGIIAEVKPDCDNGSTPILNSQFSIKNSSLPVYYTLTGKPLGQVKPKEAGVYIFKQGHLVGKIVVR
ncbi:MAG: hypothetical protein LBB36_04105 [Fibromonadaceae bacterium]|nr:hypothetical protein [Fibromonadaceae bacterium]